MEVDGQLSLSSDTCLGKRNREEFDEEVIDKFPVGRIRLSAEFNALRKLQEDYGQDKDHESTSQIDRGALGQRLTVRRLMEMQRLYHPDLLFLIETKQDNNYVRDVGVYLSFDHMILIPPVGLSGGLALFWKSFLSVSCISNDVRLVDLHVEYQCFQFYLPCVYGSPNT